LAGWGRLEARALLGPSRFSNLEAVESAIRHPEAFGYLRKSRALAWKEIRMNNVVRYYS
jgi:hypothetical protein